MTFDYKKIVDFGLRRLYIIGVTRRETMRPAIPLDKILERLREEQRPERPALRIHAPRPEPVEVREPTPAEQTESPERGVAIIDFTI